MKRLTPKHKKDLEERRERDIEWILLGITLLTAAGLIAHIVGGM